MTDAMLLTVSTSRGFAVVGAAWLLAAASATAQEEGISPEPADGGTVEVASDEELKRFLTSWSKRFDPSQTLRIDFTQEKTLKILRRPLRSKGTIRVATGRLRCDVRDAQGELESVLHVDGKRLRIFYSRLKRLEVYDLAGGHAPAMAFPIFGSDPAALERDYEARLERVTEAGGERRTRLVLEPRDPEAPVESMTFLFGESEEGELEVKSVQTLDKRGDRVHMRFERVERNARFAPGDLELEVPPGTREVRPLSSPDPAGTTGDGNRSLSPRAP